MIIWNRSSRCSSNGCVEVSHQDGKVLVRDSKIEDSPVLEFGSDWWANMMEIIGRGGLPAVVHVLEDGSATWRKRSQPDERLEFTAEEWDAFVAGATAGEFTVEALTRG